MPAGVALPAAAGALVLAVLLFGAARLLAWRPRAARALGNGVALAASAIALYVTERVFPVVVGNDPVHEGVPLVSLLDPILAASCAATAGATWRFAGERWVGGALAVGVAAAMGAKPVAHPLVYTWHGEPHAMSPTSETHLYFPLSGSALAVVAGLLLVVPPARSLAGDLPRARARGA